VTEPATEATVAPVKAKAPPAAPKAKRMDKPDRAGLDDKVAQLQATIDDSQARIAQLKGLIDAKKDSRRHVGGGGAPARAKLGQLRAEFKSVVVRGPRAALVPRDTRTARGYGARETTAAPV